MADLTELKARLKPQIQKILTEFSVKTYKCGQLLVSNCPIHLGDNTTAFNINISQGEFCGRWFCNTHKCHKEYGGDVLGLIRGLLEAKGPISFREVVDYATTLCGMERIEFSSDFLDDIFLRATPAETTGVPRKVWRQSLKIPQYYLNRKFSKEILDQFDVTLGNPDSEMRDRAVFPVYDNTWKHIVGSVGRTIIEAKPKWKVQDGFKSSDYLFGYWAALPHICRLGTTILVEGQGDVLRLWEAGHHNVVGLFGSNLSEKQEFLLQSTGAAHIITAFDSDEAGSKCRKDCEAKLRRLFNLRHVMPVGHDIGEMSIEQIKTLRL